MTPAMMRPLISRIGPALTLITPLLPSPRMIADLLADNRFPVRKDRASGHSSGR